jgi:hypothetical protein
METGTNEAADGKLQSTTNQTTNWAKANVIEAFKEWDALPIEMEEDVSIVFEGMPESAQQSISHAIISVMKAWDLDADIVIGTREKNTKEGRGNSTLNLISDRTPHFVDHPNGPTHKEFGTDINTDRFLVTLYLKKTGRHDENNRAIYSITPYIHQLPIPQSNRPTSLKKITAEEFKQYIMDDSIRTV